jgi:lysophospholipase L1-like esterase
MFHGAVGMCALGLIWMLVNPSFRLPGGLLLVLGLCARKVLNGMCRAPINNPWEFLLQYDDPKRRKAPVLVCLGDSITHGTVSANWVSHILPKLLQKLNYPGTIRPNAPFQYPLHVINAGQNSLPTNMVAKERVGPILQCLPDYVVVLIGTNDVLGIYFPWFGSLLRHNWDLPRNEPSWEALETNLRAILKPIVSSADPGKGRPNAVAICTLPPLGEDLTHPANQLIKKANTRIHSVVHTLNKDRSSNPCIVVIPLFETMEQTLLEQQALGASTVDSYVDYFLPHSTLAATMHFLFGFSFTVLFRPLRHALLTDSVHLNENGARVVSNLVVQWLWEAGVEQAITNAS